MAILLDSFDGTGDSLGAQWNEYAAGFSLSAGSAVPDTASVTVATRTTPLTSAHQFARVRLGSGFTTGSVGPLVFASAAGAGDDGMPPFYAFLLTGPRTVELVRKVDSSPEYISLASATLAADVNVNGTDLELEAQHTGVGFELTGFVNGAQVLRRSGYSQQVPPAHRRVGMMVTGASSGLPRVEDFLAGDAPASSGGPDVPTGLVVTRGAPGTLHAGWTPVANADDYGVYLSSPGSGAQLLGYTRAAAYTITGLSAETYTVTVESCSGAGSSPATAGVSATAEAAPEGYTQWGVWNGISATPARRVTVVNDGSLSVVRRQYVYAGDAQPVLVKPRVVIGQNWSGTDLALDLSGSVAGTGAIVWHTVDWGDGSPVEVLTEPDRTASHTYVEGAYTIVVTADAADGGVGIAATSTSFGAGFGLGPFGTSPFGL